MYIICHKHHLKNKQAFITYNNKKRNLRLVAGSRKSNARLSMVDFMPFSRDLSQEQLIGYVNDPVNSKNVIKIFGIPSIFLIKLTSGLSITSRGDTTNTNLQNMEPVSETDQEQVPEDLGKLMEVDKARTGRVRLILKILNEVPVTVRF